jgi:hypothetical protein
MLWCARRLAARCMQFTPSQRTSPQLIHRSNTHTNTHTPTPPVATHKPPTHLATTRIQQTLSPRVRSAHRTLHTYTRYARCAQECVHRRPNSAGCIQRRTLHCTPGCVRTCIGAYCGIIGCTDAAPRGVHVVYCCFFLLLRMHTYTYTCPTL